MKKVIFSLALAALGFSSFADVVINGTLVATSTSTTTNPDGSTTTITYLSCVPGDGTCIAIQSSMIDPDGNPMPGGQIILDAYQDGQDVLSQEGTLTQYQNWTDQQGDNDFNFQIWNPQGK